MARLWRVAHFVLTDFLELSLEEMPANLTSYPAGIPATAPSALTASMHLGVLPEMVHSCSNLVACHAMPCHPALWMMLAGMIELQFAACKTSCVTMGFYHAGWSNEWSNEWWPDDRRIPKDARYGTNRQCSQQAAQAASKGKGQCEICAKAGKGQ